MSEPQPVDEPQPAPDHRHNLDKLAFEKGLKPIESLEDLDAFTLDVWDSDEDLQTFLAEVRASRKADLA